MMLPLHTPAPLQSQRITRLECLATQSCLFLPSSISTMRVMILISQKTGTTTETNKELGIVYWVKRRSERERKRDQERERERGRGTPHLSSISRLDSYRHSVAVSWSLWTITKVHRLRAVLVTPTVQFRGSPINSFPKSHLMQIFLVQTSF